MIALIQRVSEARVVVDAETVGAIGPGILALWGIEKGDGERQAERLVQRVLGYRVFADDEGRMNRSVRDIAGGLLLVPQFTLAADTRKGTRASFTTAAPPDEGERLFEHACRFAERETAETGVVVERGRFGADMKVHLVNDGPVTFRLQARPD